MDESPREEPVQGNQLQESILSTLEDHRALSTSEIVSMVESDTETVQKQLNLMADIGQIERRKTNNQDVWLTWKNTK